MSINESIGKAGEIWRQWTQMAQEGFCSIDNDGSILDVNSAMGGFLGLESEDLVGRCIFDFVDESNKQLLQRSIKYTRVTPEPEIPGVR